MVNTLIVPIMMNLFDENPMPTFVLNGERQIVLEANYNSPNKGSTTLKFMNFAEYEADHRRGQ